MNFLDKIITNFTEWHYKVFDDGITIYSRRFYDHTHRQLKGNFHSAFNHFSQGDKTIIVSCFNTYTGIAIFEKQRHPSCFNYVKTKN